MRVASHVVSRRLRRVAIWWRLVQSCRLIDRERHLLLHRALVADVAALFFEADGRWRALRHVHWRWLAVELRRLRVACLYYYRGLTDGLLRGRLVVGRRRGRRVPLERPGGEVETRPLVARTLR